jgi:predicted Fe-Mo cluster-binding NifX family protein
MKIALTSTGSDLEAAPTGTFGRCAHFLVIDTETDDLSDVPNPAANASGGAGVQAAQLMIDRGVEAVLTGRVGPKAMDVLRPAHIRIYDIGDADARTALERFRRGALAEIRSAEGRSRARGR